MRVGEGLRARLSEWRLRRHLRRMERRYHDWLGGGCSACGHMRWDHAPVCALCGCKCPDVREEEVR